MGNSNRNFVEPGYFVFTEKEPYLVNEAIYHVDKAYSVNYKVQNTSPYNLILSLDTDTPDEICLDDTTQISRQITVERKISFKPTSKGQKSFKFYVKADRRMPNRKLVLEKIFQAEDGSVINKPEIRSEVEGLPASMKLGQTAEIIFLFTNKGDQPVTGINIEVKQIEA